VYSGLHVQQEEGLISRNRVRDEVVCRHVVRRGWWHLAGWVRLGWVESAKGFGVAVSQCLKTRKKFQILNTNW
jgi:hypothetical protein